MRRLSLEGVEFIHRWESLRLRTYLDAAGKPTIGWGHLILPGEDFSEGITPEQADDLFRDDVSHAERAVSELVTVSLTDQQFSALVSFVYNVGVGGFEGSSILRKLNDGNYVGAAGWFTPFHNSGGRAVRGLLNRRLAEVDLFLGGTK